MRKELVLMVVVLVFAAPNLEAIPISWDGGGDGYWWGHANNWSPDTVPDGPFQVTISGGSGVSVELRQSRGIYGLSCSGKVDLGTAIGRVELTLDPNGLVNYGDLSITGWGVPLFEIGGDVTNVSGAVLDFWGGDIGGDVENQTGATIRINGEVNLDGDLENSGLVTIGTSEELNVDRQVGNTGEIKIYGGGCTGDEFFENNNTGVIEGWGVIYGDQYLSNQGRVYAVGGSITVASGGAITNSGFIGNAAGTSLHVLHAGAPSDVSNNGTIEVGAGGSVAFDCNLVNLADVNLLGGTLAATTITQSADANFAGFGGITGDVQIDPDAVIKLTGPTNIVGDVNIAPGATLEISDGQTLITGHTTCDGTIHLKGGTVIFQGGCDCAACTIINEAGTDRSHFDINADGIEDFKDFAYFAESWLWQASWY